MNKFIRPVLIVTAVLLLATLCLCIVGCDTSNPTYRYDTARFVGNYSLGKPSEQLGPYNGQVDLYIYSSTLTQEWAETETATVFIAAPHLIQIDTTGFTYYDFSQSESQIRVDQDIAPAIIEAVNKAIDYVGTQVTLQKDGHVVLQGGVRNHLPIIQHSDDSVYYSITDSPFSLLDIEVVYAQPEETARHINIYLSNPIITQDKTRYWYTLTWNDLDKQ